MGDQCEEPVANEESHPVEEKSQNILESEAPETVLKNVALDIVVENEAPESVKESEAPESVIENSETVNNVEANQTETPVKSNETDPAAILIKPKGPGGRPRKRRRCGIIRSGFTRIKKRKAITNFQTFPKYTVSVISANNFKKPATSRPTENNGTNQTSLQERQLIENVVEVNKLKAIVNGKLQTKPNSPRVRSPPVQPLYPYRANSYVEQMRLKKRLDLQRRRLMLEQEIAVDAQNNGVQNGHVEHFEKKVNVDRLLAIEHYWSSKAAGSAHQAESSSDDDSDQELNNMMEPEIVIETQDECIVEYNVESANTPEPNRVLHFLSTNTEYDPSLRNQQETHQNGKLESAKRLTPLSALVKVPVGRILCNFGHVIEQARKLESHSLRCGMGGEMVYQMTLKTGSIYEAIYRCSQPNCAVRMTICSDFYEKQPLLN